MELDSCATLRPRILEEWESALDVFAPIAEQEKDHKRLQNVIIHSFFSTNCLKFERSWIHYSTAQIYPNQNICVVRVSSIRVYAYAYTQIRVCIYANTRMHIREYAYTVYARMPHWYVWANLLFLLLLTGHCFLPQSKREFSLFWIRVYSIRAYVFRLDLAKC